MSQLAITNKITTVYPTLILGGDEKKQYSQVNISIAEIVKYIDYISFLQADVFTLSIAKILLQ